jgi:HK97 family phage major capsid protein
MTDQVQEVEAVVETVEAPVEEVKAEEIEVAAEAVAEVEAVEVPAEEKSDDLEIVKKAVEDVASENAELKIAAEAAQAKADKLAEELEAKAEKLEELEAKASAPMINLNNLKESPLMEAKDQVKTFMAEGIEGLRAKAADLQISTDAQGGYALPEELRREILALEHEVSPLRQEVSVTSASTTDVKQLVSIGDAASGWVGETSARAQTDSPELAQRTATFGEVYARPRIYQHMLEDAFFNAEAWLAGEVARQFAEVEGQAFLSGNGVNKPVGILNGLTLSSASAANDTTGAFEVIDFGADGSLGATSTDIIDNMRTVVLSAKTGYLGGSKFMMNRATHNVLAGLKDANGQYFINRDIANAAGSKIFGFDIVINEDMDDIPASTGSAAPVLFGNFKRAYQIIDLVGVSMLRDPYTNPGSVLFYTRKRTGSMVLDASALKVVAVSKS